MSDIFELVARMQHDVRPKLIHDKLKRIGQAKRPDVV
jgi:hypothetical protein